MNRKERRTKESLFKKQVKATLKSGDWGEWKDRSLDVLKFGKKNMVGFYANNIYSVQVCDDNGAIVAGIRRHDKSIEIPWSHKQRIKNEIFGNEELFVECFPSQLKLIDGANMFWIWKLDDLGGTFNLAEAIK